MAPPKIPLDVRFEKWTRKDAETGCWIWLGKIGEGGYGHIKHEGKSRKAATVAYEFYKGLVPTGLVLDHLCRNKLCINPEHLEAVTQKVNWDRGNGPESIKGRKVLECKVCGSPYEILWRGRGHEEWGCRRCRAERAKQWREATGYDQTAYRDANKDRINAQRRARRAKARSNRGGPEPQL